MLGYASNALNDGDGPLLVCLHGLGVGAWCWEPVWRALPQQSVLAPDLPGHGTSAATEWQSIADTASKVGELVDHLAAGRPKFLTGHSLGAYVGSTLLTQRPDLFVGALLSGFHWGKLNNQLLLKLAFVGNSAMFSSPFLVRQMARVFGDEEVVERYAAEAAVIKPRTIRRAGIQVVNFSPPGALDASNLPIVAVSGSREPSDIRDTPARLAAAFSNVEAVVLDGRDHLWPIREPEFYAQLLAERLLAPVGAAQ